LNASLRRTGLGVFLAIAATTTMDASGVSTFSSFALLPLMVLFWHWDRLSRSEMGFVWNPVRFLALGLAHPVFVLGLVTLTAYFTGAINLEKTNWQNTWLNLALATLSTILVVSVTEEGFFRGWLWSSLTRAGQSRQWVLLWSSLAFALWHLSAVLLDTGFNPPLAQVPIFMANAAVLGAIWGMLRMGFRFRDRSQRRAWGMERRRLCVLWIWRQDRRVGY
jgi:membrane protease YdiL (CAAX protease family)